MPPFGVIKFVIVWAVQSESPDFGSQELGSHDKKRKVLFIDISKAQLYAPFDAYSNAYVDLTPECSLQGVCGGWIVGYME